jgi:hypothetical protein
LVNIGFAIINKLGLNPAVQPARPQLISPNQQVSINKSQSKNPTAAPARSQLTKKYFEDVSAEGCNCRNSETPAPQAMLAFGFIAH